MCKHLHRFSSFRGAVVVSLPFDLDELIGAWSGLRSSMRKAVPNEFSRDEWAYLINFLSPEQLKRPYYEAFGAPADGRSVASQQCQSARTIDSDPAHAHWQPAALEGRIAK